jgi:hypothetical protein
MNLPFIDSLLFSHVRRRAGTRPVRPLAQLQLDAVKRVLVVLTTGLGDAVLSTPVLPALRAALPQADIRLFCRAAWAPLFAADPDLDALIPYSGKYRRFFPTLRALRDFSPEAIRRGYFWRRGLRAKALQCCAMKSVPGRIG